MIDRSTKRWLAVAAAVIGLAAPAAAQPGGEDLKLQPPPAKNGAWPDFPPPGESTSASKIPTRPADLPADVAAPKAPIATTGGLLPSFNGVGKNGKAPQPGAFPQPGADGLDPTPAPNKIWNVSSNPNAALPPGGLTQPVERNPRDFGSGWKGVIKGQNQQVPAANLAKPRAAGLPRPEWNWHGYDSYNQGRAETNELTSATNADMAPYQKYAHQWRPAVSAGSYSQSQQGLAGSAPVMPTIPVATPLPSTTTSIEPITRPATGPATPSITIPLDPPGRVSSIQPTEFRAPLTPPPAPPVAPEPARPKVVTLPDAGGANGLPLVVRQKISEICANRCRNLAVSMQSPTRMTVSFLVKDQFEAELLTNMLSALPELAAYKVDFEVQIGQ